MSEFGTLGRRLMSRRRILTLLGAAGAIPGLTSLLAACTPQTAAPTPLPAGPSPSGATGPTPVARKVGGDLRIDVLADPLSLDPLRFNALEGQRIYRLTNNQLLKYNVDKSLGPDLASSLPMMSSDQLTYTFKLKSGVKWHDGKPFDSSDVKYTYDNIKNPANASSWGASLSFLDSVDAPDSQTFVFKMKSAFNPMMHKFALMPIVSAKIPYEQNKTYASTIVGTGPYKSVEWQRGARLVLERNAEYFEQGRPFIQRIAFQVVQENAARVTNLINGQTHVVPEVPTNQIDLLKQRGANVVILQDSTIRIYAYPSLQEGRPTRDVNFRKAVAWAMDRQAMIDQTLGGAGVPASTYLSSGRLYFDQKLGTTFGN